MHSEIYVAEIRTQYYCSTLPCAGKSIPWSMVAKQIPHRTDAMCNNRWRQLNSDEEVFEQYVKQALKRATTGLGRSTKKIDGSVFKVSVCAWAVLN